MKHNIIPEERRMKNHGGGTLGCHPNDSKVIKEIYKRRKSSLGVSKMDLYDVDVWKNEDTHEKDERGYEKLVGISLLDWQPVLKSVGVRGVWTPTINFILRSNKNE